MSKYLTRLKAKKTVYPPSEELTELTKTLLAREPQKVVDTYHGELTELTELTKTGQTVEVTASVSFVSASPVGCETFSGTSAANDHQTDAPTQAYEDPELAGMADKRLALTKPGLPARVACGACVHFQPDRIGDGTGIGQCAAGAASQVHAAWWARVERLERLRKTGARVTFPDPPPPLYPSTLRRCGRFQAQEPALSSTEGCANG